MIAGLLTGGASFFLNDVFSVVLFGAVLLFPLLAASPILLITLALFSGMAMSTMPASVLAAITVIIVLCRLFCKAEQLPRLRPVYVFAVMYFVLTLFYTLFGYGGSDSALAGAIQSIFLLFFFAVVVVINSARNLNALFFPFPHVQYIRGFWAFTSGLPVREARAGHIQTNMSAD